MDQTISEGQNKNSNKENTMIPNQDNLQEDEFDLSNIWNSLKRRKKVVFSVAGLFFLITCLYTFQKRITSPIYRGTFSLLISDPVDDPQKQNPLSQLAIIAKGNSKNDIPTLIEYLRSSAVLKDVANKFDLDVDDLSDNIEIERARVGSQLTDGVIDITFYYGNPKNGQLILESISEAYLNVALQERQQKLTDGLVFLKGQYLKAEKELKKLQNKLAIFRRDNTVIQPTIEAGVLKQEELRVIERIELIDLTIGNLKETKKKIIDGKISAQGIRERERGEKDTSGTLFAISDANQSILERAILLEKELAEAETKFTPNSSTIIGIRKRLNDLKPKLIEKQLESVNTALSFYKEDRDNSEAVLNSLKDQLTKLPETIKEYNDLFARVEFASQNLAGLQQTIESFQLGVAQNTVPWRIITYPEMGTFPVKPSIPKYLFIGGFLSIIAGMGIGLFRDMKDDSLKTIEEIEKDLINIPILGKIPFLEEYTEVKKEKKFVLDNSNKESSDEDQQLKRFFYQEAFRNLSTSIRFLNIDKKISSLLISSSIPGEGKSLTNLLLAKTFAEMGQRVLLVDADLRKPQLHFRAGINNLRGLSNLITDKNLNYKDVIQTIKVEEVEIKIITAGVKPPDPIRILSSERMKFIIEELKNSSDFDLVIYDAPPILGLSDAALIAQNIDGVILLISLGFVNRKLPLEAAKLLNSYELNFLGIISNTVSAKVAKNNANSAYNSYAGYASYANIDNQNGSNLQRKGIFDSLKKIIKEDLKNEKIKKVIIKSYLKLNRFMTKIVDWLDN